MPRSKQAERRKLAKLRAEFNGSPWAIDARALGALGNAIEAGDLEAVRASLSFGNHPESITKLVNGVAVIPVCGVLRDEVDFMVRWGCAASYQLIERDFNQSLDNNQIKGILFYFNTPGGAAIGCKRLADMIYEARGEKPIRAFVQGVCCSAGYYMAAATDRIEATADSLVGSVGTIMPHMEYSGMLTELGIAAKVFTNTDSPKKGHGNIYEPLSDEATKTIQQFVDSYGRPFIEDVARYRGIDAAAVVKDFGQGDSMRADMAIGRGMVDAVVESFEESLESISAGGGDTTPVEENDEPAATAAKTQRSSVMNERIKAQLFALGLIDSLDASDPICKAAISAWCAGRGDTVPSDEAEVLKVLQATNSLVATLEQVAAPLMVAGTNGKPAENVKTAHDKEQSEARLADLKAAAELANSVVGEKVITAEMILDACEKKLDPNSAQQEWAKIFAAREPSIPSNRVNITGEGADRWFKDTIDSQVYRAGNKIELSADAAKLVNKPLWAVAAECLRIGGVQVDDYADREFLAEQAMEMSVPGKRYGFYSEKENSRYIQASGGPATRPGDFPNILSSLARKYLDTIELDEDYSYAEVSALLPGGLNDFKPGLMINKGIVEELDELQDAEQFKELGLQEEVLSYIFLRRFGNKWGWTPVLVANDDLNAFAEGMLGLEQAWQVTQNRLVLDRYTSSETLLDGAALFANRADTGSGTNPATNDNDIDSGGAVPSDAQWALMEAAYADIGGIATGRRVRGTLNTWFGPTGTPHIEARRTFMPLNAGGLEPKNAATTANVGIYRGLIKLIPESELRPSSLLVWYGLRSPTKLNTATVVRGYFNGFGEQGKRERWYDPERKTTWVSIEGRVAVAVKNWRYAIKNKGEN